MGELKTGDAIASYNTSTSALTLYTLSTAQRKLGNKTYPFCNQVENVLVTVNDRFVPHNASGTIDYFTAQVITESDYYPFGQLMPGRNNSANTYKYGFQDQLKDDEIFNVTNTLVSAEYWEYDTRLGRRWNMDPLTYASQGSYVAFNNNPIVYIDPLGLKAGGGGKPGGLDCPTFGSGGGISWKSHPAYANAGSVGAGAMLSGLDKKFAQDLRKPIAQAKDGVAQSDPRRGNPYLDRRFVNKFKSQSLGFGVSIGAASTEVSGTRYAFSGRKQDFHTWGLPAGHTYLVGNASGDPKVTIPGIEVKAYYGWGYTYSDVADYDPKFIFQHAKKTTWTYSVWGFPVKYIFTAGQLPGSTQGFIERSVVVGKSVGLNDFHTNEKLKKRLEKGEWVTDKFGLEGGSDITAIMLGNFSHVDSLFFKEANNRMKIENARNAANRAKFQGNFMNEPIPK